MPRVVFLASLDFIFLSSDKKYKYAKTFNISVILFSKTSPHNININIDNYIIFLWYVVHHVSYH